MISALSLTMYLFRIVDESRMFGCCCCDDICRIGIVVNILSIVSDLTGWQDKISL